MKTKLKKPIKFTVDGRDLKITSIESVPDEKVYRHTKLVHSFMRKILNLRSYLLTDRSSLYDFDCRITEAGVVHSTQKYLDKIKKVYGVDVSKVRGLLPHRIFDKIQKSIEDK